MLAFNLYAFPRFVFIPRSPWTLSEPSRSISSLSVCMRISACDSLETLWKSCARGRWKGKQCFCTHIILICCLCVACTCARVEQFPPLIVAQRTLRIPEQKKPLLEAAGLVQTSTTKQSAAIAGAARQFASWVSSRREVGVRVCVLRAKTTQKRK